MTEPGAGNVQLQNACLSQQVSHVIMREELMGLRDWFRPKWKHSDWDVRKAAISSSTIRRCFARSPATDRDSRARIAATRKLTDQTVLVRIATDRRRCHRRAAATSRLADETVLAEIAGKDSDARVRLAAAERMTEKAIHLVARHGAQHRERLEGFSSP